MLVFQEFYTKKFSNFKNLMRKNSYRELRIKEFWKLQEFAEVRVYIPRDIKSCFRR